MYLYQKIIITIILLVVAAVCIHGATSIFVLDPYNLNAFQKTSGVILLVVLFIAAVIYGYQLLIWIVWFILFSHKYSFKNFKIRYWL